MSVSVEESLNRPRPETAARLMPAPSSSSRQRFALSAWVTSTVSALKASRRVRRPATVVNPVPSAILTRRSLPFCAVIPLSFQLKFQREAAKAAPAGRFQNREQDADGIASIGYCAIRARRRNCGRGKHAREEAQLHLARRFPAALAASFLIAGTSFALLLPAADARAADSSSACADAAGLAVLASPFAPWKGAPLRIIFTADKPFEGELSLIAPDGNVAAASRERHGGPPYFWFAEVTSPAAGTWHARLVRARAPAECGTVTRDIAVHDSKPPSPSATAASV